MRISDWSSDVCSSDLEVSLARAFWEYAVVYGFVLNLFTTIASFALLTTDAPAAFGLAIFFLPMPYNLFVLVAVWRAAARYVGPRHWASYARVANGKSHALNSSHYCATRLHSSA